MGLEWIGQRYGRLVVIALSGRRKGKRLWLCKCDCGTDAVVQDSNLRSGHTASCGCFHAERSADTKRTHGFTNTVEHDAWVNMRQRCNNPRNLRYADYGGRGVTVCDRWQTFEAFFSDMGAKPTPRHSIERINNDGNYEPENCRWATPSEQVLNRRRFVAGGVRHLFRGEYRTVHTLAHDFRMSPSTIYERIKNGWPIERAVTERPDSRFKPR